MIRVIRGFVFILLSGFLVGSPGQTWGDSGDPVVINLYVDGLHPQNLEVAAGTAVRWVSYLTHTSYVVVAVTFIEGQRVAQATQAFQGYGGFALEGDAFIGRMQADAGQVALRFVTPGTYTYALSHHHRVGTIVVR